MADQYQFKQNPLQPPRLTRPVQAFDTGSAVAQNMAGQGTPSASNIFAAMRTATAQRQMQQPQQAVTAPTPQPQPQQTPTPPAITSMDELAAAMGYTSPQEEERQRKASVANRRIMAVADALRHIGNIANTVNYAPAQQFNSPVAEEQARYERGKAMRDKANQTYLAYQQAKAAQDAKQRQWEAEQQQEADQWNATFKYNAERDAARLKDEQDRWKATLAYKAQNDEANRRQRGEHQKEMEKQGRQRIGIMSQNARNMQSYRQWRMNGGGGNGGSAVAPLDTPKGRITPNGRNYSNQLLQMFDYAKSQGLVQESDVAKRLRELGFGKDQSDNVKRQMVMDLLRSNPTMGDYAADRLGWRYGGGTNMDLGLEDEEDDMNLGLE